MKPVGIAGEGAQSERARSLVAASQPAFPGGCAALCFWSGSLHSPGDTLGKEERLREEMPGKNGKREMHLSRRASRLWGLYCFQGWMCPSWDAYSQLVKPSPMFGAPG